MLDKSNKEPVILPDATSTQYSAFIKLNHPQPLTQRKNAADMD
jgi:hypothetical protein